MLKGTYFDCPICGKNFYRMKSFIKGRKQLFCSRECHYKGMEKPVEITCDMCKKTYIVNTSVIKWNKIRGRKRQFCSKKCSVKWFTGPNNPLWRSDRIINDRGYVLVKVPGHPRPCFANYVYEHRAIMEKSLGRYLEPQEDVHHINHSKSDNRLENLQLIKDVDHAKLHSLERKRTQKGQFPKNN